VFGALLVNVMLSSVSSDLPSVWPFIQGGLFIGVVLLFPDGFVGIWGKLEEQVAVRAGWGRILVAASPLMIMGVFILAEGLGLTPAFLRYTVHVGIINDPVALKYLLIVVLLAVAGVAYMVQKQRDEGAGQGVGFAVTTAGAAA
jgi:hypothetical protein